MTQPQPQPTTLQMDDATTDALSHLESVLDEIKETLKRIARAVETLGATAAG